jgi:hypothetical protein
VNDEELIAEARRLSRDGIMSPEAQALARELLRQLADRLDPPARIAEAVVSSWCKGCRRTTLSTPCPRCGRDGAACARCLRCQPCDGPVPDEEE